MTNGLGERVARIEARLDNHDKSIEDFKEDDKTFRKISTLFEIQVEENQKQNETLSAFSSTLQKVNENLSQLNGTQEKIQKELTEIGTRVENVETKQKVNDQSNSISLVGLQKKIILWIVGFCLTALTAYLLIELGLK